MPKIVILFALSILVTSCDEKKIIYIADSFVDCQGVSAQKCIQVKENIEDEWTAFYNKIEGFEYEEGISYQIEVAISKVENPPEDGSSLNYKLVRIINQEIRTEKTVTFPRLPHNWEVISIKNLDSLKVNPTLKFDFDTHKISGNAGCNNYGASFIQQDNTITFKDVYSTKMMCTNMAIEKAFFENLKAASHYKLVAKNLIIFSSENNELMRCSLLD